MLFKFKQFSILQSKSAMKVGTDGVLLGAWTPIADTDTILDIGTGTGLIALMLAQRNSKSIIDAVELDEEAFEEATFNFKTSKWSNRLSAFCESIQDYSSSKKYDLIVSNPPYFKDGKMFNATKRTLARHVDNLSFDLLLKHTVSLLKDSGKCSFILPYKELENFVTLANTYGLFLVKSTHVRGRQDLLYKRSLLLFSKRKQVLVTDELVIEHDRHVYTKEYISLTQDFYLKM